MTQIGYQASHEQFPPDALLQYVQKAEEAGFQAVLSSDHIHPWSVNQGNSGFALSWLGAAMQTTSIQFGVVTVPGYRYHPAILAQAIATLENMFPGRFFLNLGSGEALNEHIVGRGWPDKSLRNEILKESSDVMRRLWQGEEVTHQGNISVDQAKLYIPLPKIPDIIGAALSDATAHWLGSWADGLITTSRPISDLKKIIEAFRSGGGEGKRLILKADLSYDKNFEEALRGAYEQWRYTLLSNTKTEELKTTQHFDDLGDQVNMDTVKNSVRISNDFHEFIDWIQELASLGFEKIILHNVNRKQDQFIDAFGTNVLPELKSDV